MSRLAKALTLCLLSGAALIALLLWGLPGPKAGKIQNPVPGYGQVLLTGVDGKRCSIQAGFNLAGKRYTTSQIPYSRDLCSYRLGQRVPIAYNRLDPTEAAALQKVTDHPIWPAMIAGTLFALSLLWLFLILLPRLRSALRTSSSPPPEERPAQKPAPSPKPKVSKKKPPEPPPEADTPKPPSTSAEPKAPIIPRSGITPPGWYPVRGRLRWWNGQRWTDNWQEL